jgi:hypothetical protein
MADVEQGWLEEGNYDTQQEPTKDNYEAKPVPVHIVATETENISPQLCIHSTLPIPLAGAAGTGSQPNVGRILPHNYHRYKAKMMVNPGVGCTAIVTSYKIDSLTNPVPSGATFNVTPTGSAVVAPAVPATGVPVQNTSTQAATVVISPNGATITNVTVNGLTVGTGAGTYIVPAAGTISIAYTVATPTWVWSAAAPPLPFYLPDYDSQRPMYMVALGGAATVSIWDEAYPVEVK